MGQVSLSDLANKTRRREGGRFKLIQRYLTQGFFEIIFMEFNKKNSGLVAPVSRSEIDEGLGYSE